MKDCRQSGTRPSFVHLSEGLAASLTSHGRFLGRGSSVWYFPDVATDADKGGKGKGQQLLLPLKTTRSLQAPPPPRVAPPAQRAFRVIRGEGKRRDETLKSRDDVARLLVGSACDLLLKRISPDRAHGIQVRVDRVMRLFDRAQDDSVAMALLRRELDDLERLYREGQEKRRPAGDKPPER